MFYERDLVATDLQSHLLRNACYCIIQMFFRFYFPSVLTSFDLEIAFFTYCLRIDTFFFESRIPGPFCHLAILWFPAPAEER